MYPQILSLNLEDFLTTVINIKNIRHQTTRRVQLQEFLSELTTTTQNHKIKLDTVTWTNVGLLLVVSNSQMNQLEKLWHLKMREDKRNSPQNTLYFHLHTVQSLLDRVLCHRKL